jgi:hypothetical protein
MEWYRHRQSSSGLIGIFLLMTLAMVVVASMVPDAAARAIVASTLAVAVALGALFSSLTTVVTDTEFIFHFSFGFWRKRIPLADIRRAEAVRTTFWDGSGIHLTRRGWLYNVWGLDAVEIERTNGTRLRVGSDDARRLADAITAQLTTNKEQLTTPRAEGVDK